MDAIRKQATRLREQVAKQQQVSPNQLVSPINSSFPVLFSSDRVESSPFWLLLFNLLFDF